MAAKKNNSGIKTSKNKTSKKISSRISNGSQKIRYGVVGLGHIAQVAVLPAFRHAKKNSVLTALVTDDPVKAKKLSKKYNVRNVYSYENFGDLLTDDVVDALYICLPNNLHVDFTTEALKAGIHVLCEKPLGLSMEEAEQMREAANSSGKKLMTAYRLHFEPSNLKTIEVCESGQLGELRYFSSDFSFDIKDPDNIRLRKENGGGPLWDIGIYCINAARNIFQAEPIEVFAMEATGPAERFQQVGEMLSATLKFPNERLATFTCSFGSAPCADYKVYGTKGSLHLKDAYEYAGPRTLEIKLEKGRSRKLNFKKNDQFGPEISYFSACILNDAEIEPSAIEGMADIRIINALYDSIRLRRPIDLKPAVVKTLKLSGKMKKSYPGFPEPETVHVTPPTE